MDRSFDFRALFVLDLANNRSIRLRRFAAAIRTRSSASGTHEPPEADGPVMTAVAKGAEILERHVGLPRDRIALNSYSSTPDQIDRWIVSATGTCSFTLSTKSNDRTAVSTTSS
jgi:hypothetical protein